MFLQQIGSFIHDLFGDKFKAVYWVIAIATAQHTAWGAATTMQGSQSEGQWHWWAQGLAFAIAIDVSMVMVATKMRGGGNRNAMRYAFTFAAVAILSSYFQLLYAWAHITELNPGAGVAMDWTQRLQAIIDARILIAPIALPGISIAYTLAGLGKGGEIVGRRNASQSLRNEGATRIEVGVEALPQPAQPKLLPGATQVRNEDGTLEGYVCPACKKELTISGWSRHKTTCKQYVAMTMSANGYGEHIQ